MKNSVSLIGYIGKDDPQTIQSSVSITKFQVATSESYKDNMGEKRTITQWHNCVAYRKTGELIKDLLKARDMIHVEGKIQYNKKEDKIYTNIVVERFILLKRKSNNDNSQYQQEQQKIEKQIEVPEEDPFGVMESDPILSDGEQASVFD